VPKSLVDIIRLVVVIGILVFATVRWFDIHHVRREAPMKPGSLIANVSALGIRPTGRALLLVTASHCHYCRESMLFYQKLVPVAKRVGTRVIAVTTEDPDVNATYLSSNGIDVDAVLATSEVGVLVQGTPTLILVGSDGVVKKRWLGRLAPEKEAELLSLFQNN